MSVSVLEPSQPVPVDQPQPAPAPFAVRPSEFRSEGDSEFGTNEFNYKPVPVTAVAGLVLALLSSVGVAIWLVLPLCALAALLSGLGLLTILRSRGEYGGKGVAWAGLTLGLAFLISGVGFQVYTYQAEVPEGFQRISFLNDISAKELIQDNRGVYVPKSVAELDGKPIFVKGYIYQSGEYENLNKFMFVKDNRDCCFGADVKIWDQLWVTLKDKQTIDYVAGKVAVAGTFRINREWNPADKQSPLYLIEGERFVRTVSDF